MFELSSVQTTMSSLPKSYSGAYSGVYSRQRRLSAPVVPIQQYTSQNRCQCSLLECSRDHYVPSRRRQLSLSELPLSGKTSDSRRLSFVESSTREPSRDSSMEIDTSSLSCDWLSVPRADQPCSGSYQPLPPECLINNHSRLSPGFLKLLLIARPVWRAIILGQILSLLLCTMALCNHYLNATYKVTVPTGQNFIHYSLLCIVYTTWLACRSGENGLIPIIRKRGWRYLLLALADVEANTLLSTAHQFTTLTSIQLLDCVSIPVALALSCLLLRVRYKMVHIIGVGVCLMGVGCLVWADIEDGRPLTGGPNQLLGDMLCLGGALLFAVITVAEEFVVKTFDWVEYLGMLGLFGCVFNGLQSALLEKQVLYTMKWDSLPIVSLICGFGMAQFVFHTIAPVVLQDSGATAMQLSLLTSDFYCLLASILLFQYKVHSLYFLSFVLVMTGILVYAIKRTPISSQQPVHYSGIYVSFPSLDSSCKRELCQETTPLRSTWS